MADTSNIVSVTGDRTGRVDRSYTVTWEYNRDSSSTVVGPLGAIVYAQSVGPDKVPAYNARYSISGETDNTAFLKNISAARDDPLSAKRKWKITGSFRNIQPGEEPPEKDATNNPLNKPARWWLESDTKTEAIEEAWLETELDETVAGIAKGTKGALVNAAGKPYDTPLLQDMHRTVIVMQKNYPSLNAMHNLNRTYIMTTNNQTYFGYKKHCAAYQGTECGEPQSENNITYWTAVTRVVLSSDPMYRRLVNEGFEAYDPVSETYYHIKDKSGHKVSEPQLLKANGLELEKGILGNTVAWRTLKEVSYNNLVIN